MTKLTKKRKLAFLKLRGFKVTAVKCLRKSSAALKATTSVLKAVRSVHVEASIFKQALERGNSNDCYITVPLQGSRCNSLHNISVVVTPF